MASRFSLWRLIFNAVEGQLQQWTLGRKWNGEPISLETNSSILRKLYNFFDPLLKEYLQSIPILKNLHAQTAYAHTTQYLTSGNDFIYMGVSLDWDTNAKDSKYWGLFSKHPYNMKPDDTVFSADYKLDLLTHEFLHIIQDYLRLDTVRFFQEVKKWYQDDNLGRPTAGGVNNRIDTGSNRMKYLLWWNLYGKRGNPEDTMDTEWKEMKYSDRYVHSTPGVEEFAYIGSNILSPAEDWRRTDRLLELSESLIDPFKGVINPDILALRIQ